MLLNLQREFNRIGDERAQYVGRYTDQLGPTVSDEERRRVESQANANFDRDRAQQRTDTAAREAKSRQDQLNDAYDRSVLSIQQQINSLDEQAITFGMTEAQAAKFRAEQELINAAMAAGKKITPGLLHDFEEYGDRIAEGTERLQKLHDRQDAANDAIAGLSGAAYDGIEGLVMGTKTFEAAIEDLTRALIRMLLQAALLGQGPLAGLFGTAGANGATGGLLGSLFGGGGGAAVNVVGGAGPMAVPTFMAPGNDNFPGGLSWIGEQGPELLNLPRGSQVVPNHDIHGLFEGLASFASQANSARAPNVTTNIINRAPGVDVQQTGEERRPNGDIEKTFVVRAWKEANSKGAFNPDMRGTYGVGNNRKRRGSA